VLSKITGKEPLLTKYSAKSAHNISRYSSEKVQKKLQYTFKKIEEVILETCKDYT
jgi:hypothetical protein